MSSRLALVVLIGLILAGCGGRNGFPGLEDFRLGPPRQGLSYAVTIHGTALEKDLQAYLYSVSEAVRLAEQLPANVLVLRRRAEADLPRLQAALRARGYYAGSVTYRLEPAPLEGRMAADPADRTAANPPQPAFQLIFDVDPGPLYRFGARRIEVMEPADGYRPPGPADLGLKERGPAEAEVILAAEQQLLEHARRAGHARAQLAERELVVDHRTRQMDVTLRIVPDAVYHFGELEFMGAEGVDAAFLRDVIGIRPGARFDPMLLERARRALIETQLFSIVQVTMGEPQAERRLPILVRLEQRRHRSIGGAIGFASDEGPRLRAFWEHRNIFGKAERLRLEAQLSRLLHETQLRFRKPHFLSRRQTLLVDGSLRFEDTESFRSRSLRAAAGLERLLAREIVGTVGVAWRFSEIRERGREELFALLALPASLRLDRTDNLLEPSHGYRLTLEATPVWDTLATETTFLRTRISHSRYLPVWNKPRLTLALRAAAGTIIGETRERIPADERFYAGGGGSVRGIPFRKAGPLDRNRDPLGGRSLLEGSIELRFSPYEPWGVVAFLDAGGAFTSLLPDFEDHSLRLGAGIGLRYATPIGPFRIDLGVPLDRRKDVDDPIQLYISFGQAF